MKKSFIIKLLAFALAICSMLCFMVGCEEQKPEHVHKFNQKITTEDFIATEASCMKKATYYYSCKCGQKESLTFEYGELGGHAFGDVVSNGNDTHTKTCLINSNHTLTESCFGGTATCVQKAICIECYEEYGQLGDHDTDDNAYCGNCEQIIPIVVDIHAVRNMNTSLSADEAINGKATDFNKVRDTLYADGYVLANLNPTTDGWFYVWEKDSNQMLLVTEEYKVHYPQEMKDDAPDASWYFAVNSTQIGNDVKADLPSVNVVVLGNSSSSVAESLTVGGTQTIYVDESIKLDGNSEALVVDKEGSNITIDLGDSTLEATDAVNAIPVQVTGDSTLNVSGGKFVGSGEVDSLSNGKTIQVSLSSKNGAQLNVEDTEFTLSVPAEELGSNEGGIIASVSNNATATLKNVKATIHNGSFVGLYQGGANVVLDNCQASITSNPSGYAAIFFGNPQDATEQNKVTIKSGSYSAYWLAWFNGSNGGILDIKDGAFTFVNHTTKTAGITLGGIDNVEFFKFDARNSKVIISGGTFQGVNWYDITEAQWEGMVRAKSFTGYELHADIVGTGANTVVTISYIAK